MAGVDVRPGEEYFDIRAWREHLGMSQEQAAQRLGMSKRAFEALDRDETKRGVDLRTRLACRSISEGWTDYLTREVRMITVPMTNYLSNPDEIEWVRDRNRNVSIICIAGIEMDIHQPTTNVGLPLRDTVMRRGQFVLVETDGRNWPILFVNRDRIAFMLPGAKDTTIGFSSGSQVAVRMSMDKVIEILNRP